jgi:hypothetical protein
MLDAIYVFATLAFFALTALIGRGLERIGTDLPAQPSRARQPGDGRVPSSAVQVDGAGR